MRDSAPSRRMLRAAAPAARTGSVLKKTVAAGAVLGVAAAAYGHFIELNNFVVRHERLPVLPAGLRPDLVINTGDNLSHINGLPPLLDALDPLMDFPGVFVPGSNCYFAPVLKNPARYLWQARTPQEIEEGSRVPLPIGKMHDAFESRGWTGLINRYDSISIGGLRLEFSGVDDPHLRYDQHPGFAPEAFDTGSTPRVRIGVAHAPYMRTLERFVADGAQAIFAGHTHGGQVCLPGGRALVSNCDLPPSRAKGVSYQQDVPVQVTAGLGTSRFAPVRLFCPPEAVLVTLTAKSE